MMLLNKPKGWGSVGRDELALRVDRFSRGEWLTLPEDARGNMPKLRSGEVSLDVTAEQQRRGKAAQSRVERGQVSRARQELTGATLAPKTDETLRELQGRRPQERIREIPVEVLNFVPGKLSFLMPLCSASVWLVHFQGLLQGHNEMLRVCLDDAEVS